MGSSYWDKITTQRISRRRAIQRTGMAGAAAGAIWMVGCGSDDDPKTDSKTPGTSGTATATETTDQGGLTYLNEKNPPVAGGRYVISTGADFGTWDAHISVAASANFFPRIYPLLVNQSQVQPEFLYQDLAESQENPDELTWNFKIRPGAMIGPNDLGIDERAMTAEDAAATYTRIKAEPMAGNGAIKPFLDTITAAGDTLTIKTTSPYAWFLYRVGIFTSTIPPKELVDNAAGIEKMRTKSAGAGPFRLSSSTEGEIAKMDKNPSYYGKDAANGNAQLPYWDGIDLKVIRDINTVQTAFKDGQISVYGAQSKADADTFLGDDKYVVNKDPATTFIAVAMNPEKSPFEDIRVRQAIGFAINRQQFVDLVYEGDAEANGLVHWPTGDYAFRGDELAKIQPFDIAEAKKLVDAVGGITIKMMYPASSSIQQHDKHLPIFLKQMEDAGIKIEQDPQDFGTWYSNYQTLNYTMSLSLNQSYENPEVPLDAHSKGGPLSDRSFFIGLDDPEIDAAIAKTKSTFDLEERVQAVRDAQTLIYSKGPTWLPLVTPFGYTVYSSKVHNIPSGIGPATGALVSNSAWIEA